MKNCRKSRRFFWAKRSARQLVERVLVQAPNDPLAIATLASIARYQGRASDHIGLLRNAIRLDPGNLTPVHN
ncbi:MAG: hypothetical protein MUD06_14190, partial [Rhodospirillales bacterium]|nr:hypothetical protein [Rhodospirillales bacterium]